MHGIDMCNANKDFSTSIHEAGHSVAASHYKIPSFPEMTPAGFSVVTQSMSVGCAGLCHYGIAPMTPFKFAVISWCGILGECLYGQPPFWVPPFKPSVKLLPDWHNMLVQQIARLSDGDRRGIIAYRDTWRSCKSAFDVVRKNRSRIIRLAKAMTKTETKKSVPMPVKFPASHEDFLRLVIGTDNAAAKYEKFLSDGVRAHWAGGYLENFDAVLPLRKSYFASFVNDKLRAAHVGKNDEEIAQHLFDEAFQTALAGERKRFERGFESQNSWENAVLKYGARANQEGS